MKSMMTEIFKRDIDFDKYRKVVDATDPVKLNGKVTQVVGLVIESEGPAVGVGELCYIYSKKRTTPVRAEVVLRAAPS